MNGIRIKIDKTKFEKNFGTIVHNLEHREPAMRRIASVMKESIRLNFHDSGRPTSWRKLKTRQGQPLRDTNRLMNSITSQADNNSAKAGTNVVYAAVQHFGARKHSFGSFTFTVPAHDRLIVRGKNKGKKTTVRSHSRTMKLPWGNIPARPFVMLQKDDYLDFQDILARHIVQGDMQ